MPLSRLENFLKNAEGSILYVNPSDFDATDSYENRGNSLTRPFKTIQRALIEAARFSYQVGKNNDKIDRTTILVYPGTHYIDNRPGFGVNTSGTLYRRTGSGLGVSWSSGVSINELGSAFNTDLFDVNNDLYKLNSVDGGVIMPRGTSIIGYDLRKTKIRPLFVPDPIDDYIAASSIFNVTGTCYFSIFTFFDADSTKSCYRNYTNGLVDPKYSHHKLTAFVYADGVNTVNISGTDTGLTDLQMYYNKLTLVYNNTSKRELPDYPSNVDFEPNVDEYRIVGNLVANNVGITSIRAGDGGDNATTTITVTTNVNHELYPDTPFLISGVGIDTSVYNGSFVAKDIVGLTTFTYTATSTPTNPLPDSSLHLVNSKVVIETDSVSSASPYIFNCSLRSVYGMSGMHADGNKATGFKSMVVAQFTGVSLQKDDNAFLDYDSISKSYKENTQSANAPLHTHSGSIYKPSYSNYHIKASNGGFIQCVSIFAIGYARHFLAESGGDMSITNSNSNFGAVSLESIGFQKNAFNRDNTGYITHILPPREVATNESESTWLSLDIVKTVSAATTSNLYLYGYDKLSIAPPHQVDSYRVGAKEGEILYLTVNVGTTQTTYTAPILMQSPGGSVFSAKKISTVGRTSGINSISSDIFTLTNNHNFYNGEKVRVFSDTGESPNNIELNKIYYISTADVSANQVKLSPTYNDATAGSPRTIQGTNNLGGILTIVSSVTDKQPGDLAHPIQYDAARTNWYINVSNSSSDNQIYSTIVGLGTTGLGLESGSTFIKRKLDNRALNERIYKVRYVIPKEAANARPPIAGFVLQESSTTIIDSTAVITDPLTNSIELKNPKIITGASYSSPVITITTELPHNLNSGDTVNIQNITSTNNPTGAASSVFNGSFVIATVPNSKTFTISGISINPGTFTNNTNLRSEPLVKALPRVYRERYHDTYSIYRIDEIKKHIPGSPSTGQDGIYHLTIIASNVTPSLSNVGYGISYQNYNQDIRNLYPQLDRDNYNSDPDASATYANIEPLGKVTTNDKRNSITKEAINSFIRENVIGFGITGVSVSGAAVTFFTDREHNLNTITAATLTNTVGAGYGNTTPIYSASLEGGTGSGASVKVELNAGSVSNVNSIVDGGSAYTKDDVLTIAGGATLATVQVTSINNNIGDGIQIVDCSTEGLNGVFKITGISGPKQFTIGNPNNVSTYTPRTDGKLPYASLVSEGLSITSLAFSNIKTGIATITTASHHGLLVGNKFAIVGTSHTIYDKSFTVNEVVGLSTFTFNVGVVDAIQTYTSGGVVFKQGIGPNALSIGEGESNLGNRASYIYAGISTTLSSALDSSSGAFGLTGGANKGFKKGDFVQINSEILRILNNNCTSVVRGQFGTNAAAAPIGTVVKKIRIIPVQFHRPSYLRASGHTFEYLGYGPGNYSTGLPQKQDRILSADEIIVSQAKEQDGGTIVYSAMNDLGEFYSGSKKLNSATGEEEIFDAPIFTYTGDDANTDLTKRLSGFFDDIVVRERITVEGGENNNQTSQFYGPVNFTQKITSSSENGIEAKNLFIKGTSSQSKLITVGISTPTSDDVVGARSGDISLLSSPTSGGYLGHIYANNDWRRFGMISLEKDSTSIRLDKLGIGPIESPTFTGSELLEVNGKAKIKYLTVTGTVEFPYNTSASNVSFAGLNVVGILTASNGLSVTGIGSTSSVELIRGNMSNNDQFRILIGGTASDEGFVEIATADNGNEPIYVRQYTTTGIGTPFGTLDRTLELLNVSGNTTIPGSVGIGTTNPLQRFQIGVANTLGVSTDGKVFVVTADAKVGIGTTNPTAKLDVRGDVLITGVSTFNSNIIQTSGLVGIGTTNPLQKFQIGAANTLGINSEGTVFVVTSNADVGIGTTNPQYKLDVVGDINFSGILREDGNQFIASRWTSGSGTDIHRISNVGIGTTIANTRITIGGTTGLSFSDNNIRIGYRSTGNSYTGASITSGDRNIFIGDGAGESTSSGSYNTFLGTQAGRNNQTGRFNLFLGHQAGLNPSSGNSNIIIGHDVYNTPIDGGSNQLVIGFGNTSWITGNNSGNVGIGTTNPLEKLDVHGAITATHRFIMRGAINTPYRWCIDNHTGGDVTNMFRIFREDQNTGANGIVLFECNTDGNTKITGTITSSAGTLGSNGNGNKYVSTVSPSGGANGDVWYQVT